MYTGASSQVLALDIAETDRIVVTTEPLQLHRKVVPQYDAPYVFKPAGLWYACGRAWMKYLLGAKEDFEHVYRLHIDDSAMLLLQTEKQLRTFQRDFGRMLAAPGFTRSEVPPRWVEVAEQYAGIEICPYQPRLRHKLAWYYSWDVASGCIWDTRIVQHVETLL